MLLGLGVLLEEETGLRTK